MFYSNGRSGEIFTFEAMGECSERVGHPIPKRARPSDQTKGAERRTRPLRRSHSLPFLVPLPRAHSTIPVFLFFIYCLSLPVTFCTPPSISRSPSPFPIPHSHSHFELSFRTFPT